MTDHPPRLETSAAWIIVEPTLCRTSTSFVAPDDDQCSPVVRTIDVISGRRSPHLCTLYSVVRTHCEVYTGRMVVVSASMRQ